MYFAFGAWAVYFCIVKTFLFPIEKKSCMSAIYAVYASTGVRAAVVPIALGLALALALPLSHSRMPLAACRGGLGSSTNTDNNKKSHSSNTQGIIGRMIDNAFLIVVS